MSVMRSGKAAGLALWATLLLAGTASAQTTLRIGLQDDPDVLDPHRARTYVSRLVFTALCDKLVDAAPDLKIVPQLATEWNWSDDGLTLTMKLKPGVTFHDGEPFNAEAVKFNLDRARSMPESMRKSEVASIESVTAVDPTTVAIKVKTPDATLLAQFADRAGMMLSPKASAAGDVGAKPVCSGPYKFVQRVQNDRITVERFDGYWNKSAYNFDRIVFLSIPDTTVRFANLRSGDLDLIERMAPSDVKAGKADANIAVVTSPGLGYMGVDFNIGNGERAKHPAGKDARVREAFSLAIDRQVLNDAVFEGLYTPGAQPFPPASPYHVKQSLPARDLDKAKALLKEAGVTTPVKLEFKVANNPVSQQVAQVLQAMTAEAGFEVNLIASDFATQLKEAQQGNFESELRGWSGRIDPDGNIHQFQTCKGNLNDGRYCNPEVDKLLNEARLVTDEAKRAEKYAAVVAILQKEYPTVYVYFEPRIFAMSKKLQGFSAHPDGMVRFAGLKIGG
jgi:peptide/nickel transport system substrate-binding protein